jgi:hypothetical protein
VLKKFDRKVRYSKYKQKTSIFFLLVAVLYSFSFSQYSSSPYGINAHVPNSQVIEMIHKAGIKWIRIDFEWNLIEPLNNQFNWQDIDDVVDKASANGICILANMGGTPSWANNGKRKNVPPVNKAYWKNFVRWTVNRYKKKIKYWAMWNEPNLNKFWAGSVEEYLDLILIPGAEAAKMIDPSCKIVGPDLAHLHSKESKWNIWLRKIIRYGGKENLDVISHHIYDNDGPLDIINKLEWDQAPLIPAVVKVLQEEGVDNKPFWITETGWDTDEVGENVQSDYYLEFLQRRENRTYINKIFFYQIIDDVVPENPKFGIISDNYIAKKAYDTYKKFIAGLYPPIDPIPSNEDNICPFISTRNNGTDSSVEIASVRHVRDSILKKTIKGNQLVKEYYKYAPEVNSIIKMDSYARSLAFDSLKPVVSFCKEIFLNRYIGLEERYLSEVEIDKIMELVRLLEYYASPELKKKLHYYKNNFLHSSKKSLNELILKLEFDLPEVFIKKRQH